MFVYRTSAVLRSALVALGVRVSLFVRLYKAARVLRVHFRGNEWGRTSCGSVATTVKHGECHVHEMSTCAVIAHPSLVLSRSIPILHHQRVFSSA